MTFLSHFWKNGSKNWDGFLRFLFKKYQKVSKSSVFDKNRPITMLCKKVAFFVHLNFLFSFLKVWPWSRQGHKSQKSVISWQKYEKITKSDKFCTPVLRYFFQFWKSRKYVENEVPTISQASRITKISLFFWKNQ